MASSRWLMLGLLTTLYGTQAIAAEEELPSDELLEFLGSFETAKGEWIDPADFEVPLPENSVAESGGEKDE